MEISQTCQTFSGMVIGFKGIRMSSYEALFIMMFVFVCTLSLLLFNSMIKEGLL